MALFICGQGNLQRLAQKLQLSLRLATKESSYDAMRREILEKEGKKEKLFKKLNFHPKLAKIYPSVHDCLTKSA